MMNLLELALCFTASWIIGMILVNFTPTLAAIHKYAKYAGSQKTFQTLKYKSPSTQRGAGLMFLLSTLWRF